MISHDEIDLEDFIKKSLPYEYRHGFNVSVAKARKKNRRADEGLSSLADSGASAKWQEEIDGFVSWKLNEDKLNVKELKFIQGTGMTRDVATQLDIEKRVELERIFPELAEFNMLVYKGKSTVTSRRAQVYPQMYKYRHFIDTMVSFLNKYDSKRIDQLDSRIKVRFKGKSVIQMNDHTFKCFEDKIEALISKHKLRHRVRTLIKKRVVEIEGSHENVKDMSECVREIISLLAAQSCSASAHPEFGKFDCFSVKSNAGRTYISKLNIDFNKKAVGSYDFRTNRVVIRGEIVSKQQFMKKLEIWAQKFNSTVKKATFELNNLRGYFKNKGRVKEQAEMFDSMVKYNIIDKSLNIYFHEYIAEDDKYSKIGEISRKKRNELENLKITYQNMFNSSHNTSDLSISSTSRFARELRESRLL